MRHLALFTCLLPLALAAPGTAQDRLFRAEDQAGRRAATAQLLDVLRSRPDQPTTVALAATAAVQLAEGSAAKTQLVAALQRANATATTHDSLARLRRELGDVVETLAFRPRIEAELPEGFPGPVTVDEIELRDYPAYRMVRTAMRGGSFSAFWPLFRHIESNGIAMTAPVQMDWQEQDERSRPVQMAFLYGDPKIEPAQVAKGVEVVAVEAMTVLSIGAIGDDRRDRVEAMHERLRTFLAAPDCAYEACGPLRTMGYNSPMVPKDQRYFEVQLPVRKRAAAAVSGLR
ncbi:MAG: heme-binding protein [Planctomycetes bacterium]|nr:heme-binding protein [Planctomycetota bacterium]MCB9885592.1 heme-binding protein [Planctomycetota bacterium]